MQFYHRTVLVRCDISTLEISPQITKIRVGEQLKGSKRQGQPIDISSLCGNASTNFLP